MLTVQPVELSVTDSGAGQSTKFRLDRVPTKIGLSNVGVLGFLVGTPTVSFPIAAGKLVDGVTLSQLLSSIRLTLSPMAPPAAIEGGAILIDSVSGYDVLNALALISGQEVIAIGADLFVPDATGNGVTDPDASYWKGAFKRQVGWLHQVGPFGEGAPTTGSTFSDRVWFYLPVGTDRNPIGSAAIPADWFRSGGLGGELAITSGSSVDGATVTYSGTWDLYAVCLLTGDVLPVPAVPRVRKYTFTQSSLRVQNSGHTHLIAFSPPLFTGAVQNPSYSSVELRIGDVIVNLHNAPELALRGLNTAIYDRRFSFAAQNIDVTGAAQKTRYARPFLPLVAHDWAIPPRLDDFTINILSTQETTHHLLVVGRTPVSYEVKAALRNDKPVTSITSNGCHCQAR